MDWLAYSDGTDLFMNCYPIGLQSHYSKVLIEGEYLFFNSGIKESTVTAILFGLVGGVISSWIIAGKRRPYVVLISTRTPIQLRKKSMEQLLSVAPELRTAYLKEEAKTNQSVLRKYIASLNSQPELEQREKSLKMKMSQSEYSKTVDLVLNRNKRKQLAEELNLVVSDSITKSMEINSYERLKMMYFSEPIKVCLDDNSSCIYLDYSEASTHYVDCSITETDPHPQLEIVDLSTGEWNSELAKEAQKRRRRKEARLN